MTAAATSLGLASQRHHMVNAHELADPMIWQTGMTQLRFGSRGDNGYRVPPADFPRVSQSRPIMHKLTSASFGSIKARPPLCLPSQRIGLLGGSFDPPHEAHKLISNIALRRLQLDALWWLVTPGNPLKSHAGLPTLDARLEECRKFAANPRIRVTGFEQQLATPYSAATMRFLRLRRPQTRFIWVMGADNLASFHRWQNWRSIFALMPIAVVDRPLWHLQALASPAAKAFAPRQLPESRAALLPLLSPPVFTYLTGPQSSLSSTRLRDRSNT